MATHRGNVIVPAIGTGLTTDDAQRPGIVTAGKWEDITRIPSALYIDPPPNSLVIYLEADEAEFIALGDDVIWYEELPPEVV